MRLGLLTALILFAPGGLPRVAATPVDSERVRRVVEAWRQRQEAPLGARLGRRITAVEPSVTADGELLYYLVRLQPRGVVLVAADDGIEPIMAFSDADGKDPGPLGRLRDLARRDLSRRSRRAHDGDRHGHGGPPPKGRRSGNRGAAAVPEKWRFLESPGAIADPAYPSFTCVAPLLTTVWGQTAARSLDPCAVGGPACYNYYTPRIEERSQDGWTWEEVVWNPGDAANYPCGCVATALAQIMRYHAFPQAGIGRHGYPTWIKRSLAEDGQSWRFLEVSTLGGDGWGGPYAWDRMPLRPDAASSVSERQAIGALCHDAGVALGMSYASEASVTDVAVLTDTLRNLFQYRSAVSRYRSGAMEQGWALLDMINPNLDAGYPVLLALYASETLETGHAVVCDGYGYDNGTLYHHLNFGWDGADQAWYNLPYAPVIGTFYGEGFPPYDIIDYCAYNLFPAQTGEIVSGRVTDGNGIALNDVTVSLRVADGPERQATTNAAGIYAFTGVPSLSACTVGLVHPEAGPQVRSVRTGLSAEAAPTAGNRWAVDFPQAALPRRLYVRAEATAGRRDGSSWTDAYTDLQDALEAAHLSYGQVEEIWVAAGHYRPDRGTGVRTLSFQIPERVAVIGGFAGDEVRRQQRDPGRHATVLTGDLADNDDPADPNSRRENSLHVVSVTGTRLDTVLDGVTLAGGYADGILSNSSGAGLYVQDGQIQVMNCSLVDHVAARQGGALGVDGGRDVLLVNCLIAGNRAGTEGGAAAVWNGGQVTFVNCTISDNAADGDAGGIRVAGGQAVVSNAILWNNRDGDGSDLSAQVSGDVSLGSSCVQGLATGSGGNFGRSPAFLAAAAGNYRLAPDSPCRDQGVMTALPPDTWDWNGNGECSEPLPIDRDGRPRLSGPGLDLGAYEASGTESTGTES